MSKEEIIKKLESIRNNSDSLNSTIQNLKNLIEKTSDEKKKDELNQALINLESLKDLDPNDINSIIENFEDSRSKAHNLWTLYDYKAWAKKVNLKRHPYFRKKEGNKVKYVDINGNEILRDINREKKVIKEYLQNQTVEYFDYLKFLSEQHSMKPMEENCRVSILLPVYNEGKNVRRFLEKYSLQKRNFISHLEPEKYEFNIILNRRKGLPEDKVAVQSINEFKIRNPEINVNWISIEFPKDDKYGKAGVGFARKIMADLILLRSLKRKRQSDSLYIETEDCDHIKVDSFAIHNVINTLDSNPHLDAVYGIQDRDPEIMQNNDLIFMERRLWYFIERILQRENLSVYGKKVERSYKNSSHWNFNWHRVVTGGWNCAYTAEAYALIGGYDSFRTQGEDMDIGQKISIMRGQQDSEGNISPVTFVIGRTNTRISSSPRRFILALAKEEAAYASFEDEEEDKKLKSMTEMELLEELKDYGRISLENLNKFQGIMSGMFNFLLSVEGEGLTQDDNIKVAKYIFSKAMFFLGFKKDDYDIKWVDYTDNKTKELKKGWGIEVKSFQNFKRYLEEFRRFKKFEKFKDREIDSIESVIKKMESDNPNVSLYWRRKKTLAEIEELLGIVKDVKGFEVSFEEILSRLNLLKERSSVLDHSSSSANSMWYYLQDLKNLIVGLSDKMQIVKLHDIIEKIHEFEDSIKDKE